MWPQILYISFCVLGLGFAIAKHGEPSDPFDMRKTAAAIAVAWSLLYWGGFFDPLLK